MTSTLTDLGTFEGFNFRDQAAIMQRLTAEDVVNWDHDADGEAEFWPAGDEPLVSGVFLGNITASDLTALNDLLDTLDGDRECNLLRIQFATRVLGSDLHSLTAAELDDNSPMIFYGDTQIDVRKNAAYELFETSWPDLYKVWEQDQHGILTFDWNDFIDSPMWSTHEVSLGNREILMVLPS